MSSTDPPPGKVIIDGKESNSGSNTNSNTIQEGEEGANEELQVPLPMVTRFPIKLMQILDENAHSEVIQWLPHGRGFLISNKKRFAEEILPKYFKESKYTSFTRRLNRWNFVIQTHGRSKASYFHPSFVRDGDHNALLDMQPQPQTKNRKRSKSSNSAGGSGGRKGRAGRQQEEGKEDPSSSSSGGNNRAGAAATSSSSSLPPSNVASMMGGYSGAGAAAAMYGQQQHHPQYPSQEHHQQLPMPPIAQQQAHQMMQHHQAQQQHQQNLTERGRSASISGTGPGSGGYHPSGGDSSSGNAMNSSMNTNLGMAPLPWNPHQQQQHPQQPWNNPRQPYGPYDGSYDGGGGARGSTAAVAGARDSSSSSLPANSNQSAADASGSAIGSGNSTANNPINSPPHYFHNNSNPYFPILQGGQRQGGGPGQQYQGGSQDRRQENRDQQSSGASHHYGQHQQFEYGDGRPSGGSNLAMRMQDAANQQRGGGDGFYNRNYFSQHSGFPGDFSGMMRSSNFGAQPGDQMANPPRYSPFPVGGGVGNPQQPQPYSPSYNQQQQRQQMFPTSSYGGQYGDFSRQDNRGTHVDVRQGQSQSANSNSTMRGAGDTQSDLNIMVDPPLSTQSQQYQEGGTYPDTGASTTYPGPVSSSGFGFSADQLANTSSGGSGAADLTMNQFFDPPRGHIASSSGPASSQMQQGRLYGAMERLPNVPMGEPRGFGDNFPHDSGNVITIGRPSSGVGGGSSSAPNNDVKDSAYAPLDHNASGAIPAPPPSSLFDDKAVPYKSEAD